MPDTPPVPVPGMLIGVVSKVASLSSMVTTAVLGLPSVAPPPGLDSETVSVSSTPSTVTSSMMVSGTVAVVCPSAKLIVWLSAVQSTPGVAVGGGPVDTVTETAPSVPPTRCSVRGSVPCPWAPRKAPVVNCKVPACATAAVVTVIDQPPPMEPISPLVSSRAYSCQGPLGLVPLNTERAVAEEGAGAGGGKVSAPSLPLVGRYVPVTTVPLAGMLPAARSSNVWVPLTAKPPALATSDVSTRFCPAGPTGSTSMSWAIA